MTDNTTIILALISLVGTIVTASITAYVLIKVGHVEVKADAIAVKVDGKMDALLAASVGKATAEGIATGEQAQRDRSGLPEVTVATPVTIQNQTDNPVPIVQTNPKP